MDRSGRFNLANPEDEIRLYYHDELRFEIAWHGMSNRAGVRFIELLMVYGIPAPL